MKVVYYGSKGIYAAYGMAAIHIGFYPENTLPPVQKMLEQWRICKTYGRQYGNMIYMGLDEKMQEVYIMGCAGYDDVAIRAYKGMDRIFGIQEEIYYIDSRQLEGRIPRMASFLSPYTILKGVDQSIFLFWFKKMYGHWVNKVCQEKQNIRNGDTR